jgi:hypothetical protein|tara:strand:- start:30 stop:173 length:144 start_codon:yes stop_codon:yes gene_type:complete
MLPTNASMVVPSVDDPVNVLQLVLERAGFVAGKAGMGVEGHRREFYY